SISNTVPGQNAVLSFAGTAGQRVSFNTTGGNTMGYPSVTIKNPDGTSLKSFTAYSSTFVDPVSLAATGTYTVYIDPAGNAVGTMSLLAYAGPPDVTLLPYTTLFRSSISNTVPGQNAVLSFAGTAGQRVSFNTTGGNTMGYPSVTIK